MNADDASSLPGASHLPRSPKTADSRSAKFVTPIAIAGISHQKKTWGKSRRWMNFLILIIYLILNDYRSILKIIGTDTVTFQNDSFI